MSTTVLNYSPGQLVSLFFETKNSAGMRADGYAPPIIERIILPSLALAQNYPQNMSKIDVGLYRSQFTLPGGSASAVGSYIVDITYFDPDTAMSKQTFIQVQCNSVSGKYTATVG